MRLLGAIVCVTALGAGWSGAAYADTGQDDGSNRGDARRSAKPADTGQSARQALDRKPRAGDRRHADAPAVSDAVRSPLTARQGPGSVAASIRSSADAAAVPPDLEDIAGFAMSAAAERAALGPGGPVPTVGIGGLVPNARALAAYISTTYPGVQAIGGVRADPLPDHPSGHAIDIMIGFDMGLGDAINADVQAQAGRFGVSYTLWRVANHFNHVHVTVF